MMNFRSPLIALVTALAALSALSALPGCAISRDQTTVGAYIDDTAITTAVKARFVENKQVDAVSIKVETLNGEVLLSGFAKDVTERMTAESIARNTKGVRSVANQIVVRS